MVPANDGDLIKRDGFYILMSVETPPGSEDLD